MRGAPTRPGAYTASLSDETRAAQPGADDPLLAPHVLLTAGAGQEAEAQENATIAAVPGA